MNKKQDDRPGESPGDSEPYIALKSEGVVLRSGSGEDSGVTVNYTVSDQVVEDIARYARSDTSRELGGVLLGSYERGEKGFHVKIEASIEARHAEASRANIKFTHETWAYVDRVREERCPDLKIVGWFHTHPGFGIFLSDYDQFIHKNFFNLPWQVAYVVDPLGGKDGYFGWENGEIAKLGEKSIVRILGGNRAREGAAGQDRARSSGVAGDRLTGEQAHSHSGRATGGLIENEAEGVRSIGARTRKTRKGAVKTGVLAALVVVLALLNLYQYYFFPPRGAVTEAPAADRVNQGVTEVFPDPEEFARVKEEKARYREALFNLHKRAQFEPETYPPR